TVTGRERRCGWLDLVALRFAVRVNGITSLALTKLDVLSAFPELPVCVRYRLPDGTETDEVPAHQRDFPHCQPAFESPARRGAPPRRCRLAGCGPGLRLVRRARARRTGEARRYRGLPRAGADTRVRVLLVGSGGREHALAWKLAQSRSLTELHAAPGSPGIAALGECHP